MGFGRFVHHIGTFLIFVAMVLLIVVDITAPVVNSLAIMKVELGSNRLNANEVTFGTFGYCIRGVDGGSDQCTHSHIGYNPAQVINSLDGTPFGSAAENTSKGLTRVMVLHAVATGLCFIAFLLCVGAGIVGAIVASVVAALSFIVTLVVMITDFVAFSVVKHDINDHGVSDASWSSGIWLVLVAAVFTLVGTLVVFTTCCCARRSKNKDQVRHKETWTEQPRRGGKRRFW